MAKFITGYDQSALQQLSDQTAVKFDEKETPSRTQQQFADDCDINNIMARYLKTGEIDHVYHLQPQFGNLADLPTYHEALNVIAGASTLFEELPAHIRETFDNDPANLIAAMNDEGSRAQLEQLGILNPVAEPEKQASSPETLPSTPTPTDENGQKGA